MVHHQHDFAYTIISKKSPKGSVKVIDFIRQLKDIDLFISNFASTISKNL